MNLIWILAKQKHDTYISVIEDIELFFMNNVYELGYEPVMDTSEAKTQLTM